MNDASHVPSGLAAVGRCGAVTPKFNQAGGSVEVLIKDSLPEGTEFGPQPIPER